ncbi:uncharacterized protein LOC103965032 [Pyrus x bretschneideri]|uniref:uncharacterized protein LOC103965032 n=1 Tax=Pyrus x bretschneideri TaxID=225117 RepID=UPI002030ECA8|nr:uncharacterized protein LOC103965032 [Pyrus x bretschneideri]
MVGGVRRGCLEHWYGVSTVVAKVSRIDWLTNVVGLVDPNYWRRTLNPRLVLNWYLKRVDDAVQEAKEFSQGGTLSFIGHSAGGWLARLYKEEFGFSDISLLSTLGTPHLALPNGVSGVIDQTRGLLDYVMLMLCPRHVLQAKRQGWMLNADNEIIVLFQVCGQADVWGDELYQKHHGGCPQH